MLAADFAGFDRGGIVGVSEGGVVAEAIAADAEPVLPGATEPQPNRVVMTATDNGLTIWGECHRQDTTAVTLEGLPHRIAP